MPVSLQGGAQGELVLPESNSFQRLLQHQQLGRSLGGQPEDLGFYVEVIMQFPSFSLRSLGKKWMSHCASKLATAGAELGEGRGNS